MNHKMQQRVDAPEILDNGNLSAAERSRSLEDLRRLNDWLFGVWVTLLPIKAGIAALPKPVTVLDIATGSGQMAQCLAAWAAREWRAARIIAIDLLPRHLLQARARNHPAQTPNVHLAAAHALSLPFANQSIDIVTSSLFLHHLNEDELRYFFSECRRVAKYGIVMTDLWRHPLPFALYRLIEPLIVRSPVTRHDSRISFGRAYTPREMQTIARRDLPGARVRVNFPSLRWILEWWRQ